MKKTILSVFLGGVSAVCFAGTPLLDRSADRAKTDIQIPYERLGTLVAQNARNADNTLTIGCETLDRDYANYDEYKDYLSELGIKRIRLQGGWAKTEKVRGKYDFAWLDHIVDDARARGMIPWLQTAYGNTVYKGGGTPFLKGGMPNSTEGKAAWDRWVSEMAKRYAGKVEWEMWNEPDINHKTPVSEVVDNNIRTAEIIRRYDPSARIAALTLASTKPERANAYIDALFATGKADSLFDWISYHGYKYRPESSYIDVEKMQALVASHSKKIVLRQGENGAPSKGYQGGALSDYPWTELTQAKWNLRRMSGDHGRGIWTSCFSISDMHYGAADSIKTVNVKGLLGTDKSHRVVRVKRAFYAVQNFASVFDVLKTRVSASDYKVLTEHGHSIFAFADNATGLRSFLVWFDAAAPTNFNHLTRCDVEVRVGKFKNPVWVDLITGYVCEIPKSDIAVASNGHSYTLKNIPIYDSPILVADRSLVKFAK